MPQAENTKVWNEDLVTALRCREEKCRQQFSQRQYLWRDGAAAIASVRKDIYQYKNGRIVGLPRTLTNVVEEECRRIIEGERTILPEGYLPTTLDEQNMSRGPVARKSVNPYHKDPYLQRIKMRGGSYAILMALHFSEAKVMTQKQICNAAQKYCDEEMESNFYSGRSYGAWSSKKTLVKHGLIKESRTTQMGRHGQVCNGVFEYSLTEDGKLFIDALLVKFPQSSEERSTFRANDSNATIHHKNDLYQTKEKSTINIKLGKKFIDKENFGRNGIKVPNRLNANEKIEDHHCLLLSDSDEDDHDDYDDHGMLNKSGNHRYDEQEIMSSKSQCHVIDLLYSSDEESVSELFEYHQIKRNETFDSQVRGLQKSHENILNPIPSSSVIKKEVNLSSKLVIVIDDRERNKNRTPRYMRIELSRHLSHASGSLCQIWPSNLPIGEVEEDQLNYGDFAFLIKSENPPSIRRLPVVIERKRISDLAQRSSRAHHWQQLHRMRDCCDHAILLIEGNVKMTSNFSTYENIEGESWNPDHHTIDDEHAFYRFLGRAILSSPIVKILQTPHEQASYRSIGATGLVASLLSWDGNAPKKLPNTKVRLNHLYNKLKSRGIPWQISRRISEELGSIQQLDKIYQQCEASSRSLVLVPIIKESCSSLIQTENSRSLLEYGTVEAWSSAIHSAWYSRLNDPSQVIVPYEENKYFANDRAELLKALHRGKTGKRAVQESNAVDDNNIRGTAYYKRTVRIECTSTLSAIFPSDIHIKSFYETASTEENPLGLILPSVVMQTTYGAFRSNKLVVCVMEGNELLQRVRDLAESQSLSNFTDISKTVAAQISCECSSFLICPKYDRKVLLVRGLGVAMGAAAKQAHYRAEYRVLVDLVIAELMLRHNLVLLQAPRLTNDVEMILRELAMACFYYQLTTRRSR